MNNISNTQNKTENIKLLAAQSQLYTDAKFRYNIQFFLSVVVPPIFTVLLYFASLLPFGHNLDTVTLLALYSLLTFSFDVFYLDNSISTKIGMAASVQQLFDSNVLELPQEHIALASPPSLEYVNKLFKKYCKDGNDVEYLHDWYNEGSSELPIHVARLICQRQNMFWNKDLRSGYAKFIKIIGGISLLVIVVVALLQNLSLLDFVTSLLAPVLPIALFAVRQSRSNKGTIAILDILLDDLNDFWDGIVNRRYTSEAAELFAYTLQERIFRYRMESSLVPDAYYHFYRNDNEEVSQDVAKVMADEFIRANKELI